MNRSSHHKKKHRNNRELSLVSCNEGTSARTRPLSFEDIMLRRKNKNTGGIQSAFGEPNGKHNIENASDGPKTDGDRQHYSIRGGSIPISEDSVRIHARRKEDNTYSTNDNELSKDRSGESRERGAKLSSVITTLGCNDASGGKSDRHTYNSKRSDRSNKDSKNESGERHSRDLCRKERSGGKAFGLSVTEREHRKAIDNDHKQVYGRSRDVDQTRHDYKNEPQKRHSRALTGRDKYAEESRVIPEKQSRRKHQDEDKERTRDQDAPRKHDKRESKNSEFSKMKEKEPSRNYYEDLRPKRKRSVSRERDKERSRMSSSVSPMAHRQKLVDDQDNSYKDKSQRSHVDTERKRISTNDSNSNHRRYSGSSSGLGGYSPRKRKTDAAAKTPSPTTRSPERRTAGWDHPPVGKECDTSSSLTSNVQLSNQIASENGPKPLSVIPTISAAIKPVGISQYTSYSQIHAIDSIQLTQATRPMRRLYVENIPSTASEKAVVECINGFLLSSGVNHIKGTSPCISCMIHKEKGQALLEFLTPEDASAALSFDGRSFFGSVLNIRRPKDFVDVTTGVDDKSVDATTSISDNVEDSSHKIFIGGISKVISAEMLTEIVEAFGPLKAFHFEHNVEGVGQCAFLEYVDHLVTQKACAGLNGMKLGGQVLTVVQATPDAPTLENANQLPLYGIPEHAKPLLQNPTGVLKLKNVLDPVGLLSLSEAELEEILEDIRLECARFGTVKAINVVKPIDNYTIGEAFTAVDGSGSAMDYKDNSEEASGESITYKELANNITSKPPNRCIESVSVDETVHGDAISAENLHFSNLKDLDDTSDINFHDGHSHYKPVGDIRNDESHERIINDGNLTNTVSARQEIPDISSAECTKNLYTSTTQLMSSDGISDASPVGACEMKNEMCVMEKSFLDNVGRSSASEPDSCGKMGLEILEKGENKEEMPNVSDCFEAGCVLVEFKRIEASSMAAHCLHGRLFDGRIVTVEHVDPDLYYKRFPK